MNPLVQEWLQKADEDRRSAQILLRDAEPLVTQEIIPSFPSPMHYG